ncbi:protein PIN-LIKES 6 isoform X2 [Cryptomeria japonica]|uniref:protein PIN-LIKES 6 isoform X2 n=1 Tax=Cryptomeria japonica TaxID=3369 RepID=UPI0027DA699C|nr:protein PIN-LIKES 6 isoform X2 [Cryptomeria japonica]
MLAAMEGDSESIMKMIKFAVLPIAKVFVMCGFGFVMATKYINILTPSSRKLLNGLVFALFLPCLIFTQLGRALTLQKMIEWCFLWSSKTGIIYNFIFYKSKLKDEMKKACYSLVVFRISYGNIGNVPLVLINAICRDRENPFGDPETCDETGSAYISFGQWVGAVILYTYVFYMLSPPQDSVQENLGSVLASSSTSFENPDSLKVSLLESEDGNVDHPQFLKVDWYTPARKLGSGISYLVERLRLKQIMQPPIVASIFAMVIGGIPILKSFILTNDAPLFFVTDSCIILGGAMIPCIMLALGGNLVGGPGSSKLGWKTTVAIIVGRLFFVPPVGLGIVTLADKLGFLPPNDKMFRFVLLLQHTMPTSVLSGAVANIRGFGVKEAAAVLFWVHICAVFSMAIWIILYLRILF